MVIMSEGCVVRGVVLTPGVFMFTAARKEKEEDDEDMEDLQRWAMEAMWEPRPEQHPPHQDRRTRRSVPERDLKNNGPVIYRLWVFFEGLNRSQATSCQNCFFFFFFFFFFLFGFRFHIKKSSVFSDSKEHGNGLSLIKAVNTTIPNGTLWPNRLLIEHTRHMFGGSIFGLLSDSSLVLLTNGKGTLWEVNLETPATNIFTPVPSWVFVFFIENIWMILKHVRIIHML